MLQTGSRKGLGIRMYSSFGANRTQDGPTTAQRPPLDVYLRGDERLLQAILIIVGFWALGAVIAIGLISQPLKMVGFILVFGVPLVLFSWDAVREIFSPARIEVYEDSVLFCYRRKADVRVPIAGVAVAISGVKGLIIGDNDIVIPPTYPRFRELCQEFGVSYPVPCKKSIRGDSGDETEE